MDWQSTCRTIIETSNNISIQLFCTEMFEVMTAYGFSDVSSFATLVVLYSSMNILPNLILSKQNKGDYFDLKNHYLCKLNGCYFERHSESDELAYFQVKYFPGLKKYCCSGIHYKDSGEITFNGQSFSSDEFGFSFLSAAEPSGGKIESSTRVYFGWDKAMDHFIGRGHFYDYGKIENRTDFKIIKLKITEEHTFQKLSPKTKKLYIDDFTKQYL